MAKMYYIYIYIYMNMNENYQENNKVAINTFFLPKWSSKTNMYIFEAIHFSPHSSTVLKLS